MRITQGLRFDGHICSVCICVWVLYDYIMFLHYDFHFLKLVRIKYNETLLVIKKVKAF